MCSGYTTLIVFVYVCVKMCVPHVGYCCVNRWGPLIEQATYKNRQRLYLSEQTDGSVPNTLVIANCEIVKPRVAAAEHIAQVRPQ
ncbi:hypothetical protein M8C21_013187 [Ambrosia artemisiifolia]|uniref:Secreted protein n=1 Tax=Ambrosia artemisiifolia TaxID=4212 RepID=A0AAD5G5D4_AMBAR|nr:hypothetical protein M8C21_013187 [Ambrosia artemisiifolia]